MRPQEAKVKHSSLQDSRIQPKSAKEAPGPPVPAGNLRERKAPGGALEAQNCTKYSFLQVRLETDILSQTADPDH